MAIPSWSRCESPSATGKTSGTGFDHQALGYQTPAESLGTLGIQA